MSNYTIGLDFGTNTCRALIVDLSDGREVATAIYPYPSGTAGIITDRSEPNLARQHPADYLNGLEQVIRAALEAATESDHNFAVSRIVGIGVDTTGSTPIPMAGDGRPLALHEPFATHPAALAWLWKDHTSHVEADEITALAAKERPLWLERCGGAYSAEWFWAKLLCLKRSAPEVFAAMTDFVELCDFIPGELTGTLTSGKLRRSACTAGHKAFYGSEWGGAPDQEFLQQLDPELAHFGNNLFAEVVTSDQPAGHLTPEWAARLGLPAGITVAAGALDAHVGAVGAGIAPGMLVKVLGTSLCDLMVLPPGAAAVAIPGVAGIIEGSVLPGSWSVEAGQAAGGDLFSWFATQLTPGEVTEGVGERLNRLDQAAVESGPGASGLLALDWNNGNRNPLADFRLTGLLLGQTLQTSAAEVHRALIEATAFGGRTIIDLVRSHGVVIDEVIVCGGLAEKSPLLLQIFADIYELPLVISASQQTCALGAAIFGAVAAGAFENVAAAQQQICRRGKTTYRPIAAHTIIYRQLYRLYRELHDAFGTTTWQGNLQHVMKELIALREARQN